MASVLGPAVLGLSPSSRPRPFALTTARQLRSKFYRVDMLALIGHVVDKATVRWS